MKSSQAISIETAQLMLLQPTEIILLRIGRASSIATTCTTMDSPSILGNYRKNEQCTTRRASS